PSTFIAPPLSATAVPRDASRGRVLGPGRVAYCAARITTRACRTGSLRCRDCADTLLPDVPVRVLGVCRRLKGMRMRFRDDRDVLAAAVTWTARSLPTRPPVPVLAGVRIEADTSGVVQLSSFDYEVSARSEIAADVGEPGTVLVSGRLLAEISRALPAKPVDVVLEGTKVTVTCGASRFSLLTMPVEDYPAL